MTGDSRMFNSINTNDNDGIHSITFGDNVKGKVKGLCKIAISNDSLVERGSLLAPPFIPQAVPVTTRLWYKSGGVRDFRPPVETFITGG